VKYTHKKEEVCLTYREIVRRRNKGRQQTSKIYREETASFFAVKG
jgi:hypothetical protein